MSRTMIKPKLLDYFAKHSGAVVYAPDLASHLGVTVTQVQNAVNNLRNEDPGALDMRASIKVVARGNSWIYRPVEATPDATLPQVKRLFTEIGPTSDGALVLQCEDGRLFRAVEL